MRSVGIARNSRRPAAEAQVSRIEQRRLARRDEPCGRVGAEGRARLVEVERAQHAAVKEAVLAAEPVAALALRASPLPFASARAPRRSPSPARPRSRLPLCIDSCSAADVRQLRRERERACSAKRHEFAAAGGSGFPAFAGMSLDLI